MHIQFKIQGIEVEVQDENVYLDGERAFTEDGSRLIISANHAITKKAFNTELNNVFESIKAKS